ncbi:MULTISPECIES: hypothetical protein [Halobacillus]|uniref:hypothetical protein n=1 Tax=Halobacillus TaxID=45667 RepID=UPI0009A80E2F|nr:MULTISPECIES: hypothetical protein [Halobacillus]
MIKQKILVFVLCFLFLFEITMQIGHLLPFIAENMGNLNLNMIKDKAFTILLNPLDVNPNPLFYMLLIGSIFYSAYLAVTLGKEKEGWEVDPNERYHGSARFAKPKEIFTGNEFKGATRKDVFHELMESIETKGGD